MNSLRILRNVSQCYLNRCYHITSTHSKNAGASAEKIEDPIVLSDDGSYFICWHPEKPYPYEHTIPLPPEKEQDKYVLKNMGTSDSLYEKNKHPNTVAEELASLTYTTKHRWFPRARDKYAKKTPRDREYL